jgi:site-specific recombinase XerD
MFKRSGVWWMCIRHEGRKIQKSLGTSNRQSAQKIEAKIRTNINEGNYFEKPIGSNKTFKQLMEKFMLEYSPKKSENMQRSYNTSLKHLNLFFGDLNLVSVSPKTISRYKVLRRNEGAAPASINRELAMLSKAFTLAVEEWEWLDHKPFNKVPREEENNEIERYLTLDEEKKLLANCPEWLKDLIVFSLNTGLRQDEQLSLSWSRVSLLRKTILIQETKSGKPRCIPLNQTTLNILERKAKKRSIKDDLVFFNSRGTKIDKHNLIRAFREILKRLEIADFSWHGLRRTFATRLVQKGVDIYKISKLLGHEDVRTTQKRYAHHCPESLRNGVEILDADYNLTTISEKNGFSGASNLS